MQWLFKPIGDVIMIMSIFFIQSMHHIHIEATLQISTTRVEKAYFFIYITQSFNIGKKASNTWKKSSKHNCY